MKSSHRVFAGDSRNLSQIDANSVELVVTSPPYPMISMWDDLFADLNPDIQTALDEGDGRQAFTLMHDELSPVWKELQRTLVPGGIAAINIGDATRTIGGHFEVYPNHRRLCKEFIDMGFHRLPHILWHKPTNSGTKFMGSGMIPPNAYPTLEHEYILLFRNGTRRTSFEDNTRYESAYFWEERNTWFTDLWTDINGSEQSLPGIPSRNRSAAYPIDIPLRLINMYSVYGDTILDPFWGTGTTTLAAMVSARDSIGVELDNDLVASFQTELPLDIETVSEINVEQRVSSHLEFMDEYIEENQPPKYETTNGELPVITKQETDICFYTVDDVENTKQGYTLTHTEHDLEQYS